MIFLKMNCMVVSPNINYSGHSKIVIYQHKKIKDTDTTTVGKPTVVAPTAYIPIMMLLIVVCFT